MNARQQGFTLIELIVVIVVLGILAATIVPRFTNIQTDARAATVQGLEASVRSAASMYHGVKLALGTAAGVAVPASRFEGLGSDVADANLYPAATVGGATAGIGELVQDTGGDFTIACGGGTCTWTLNSAPTPANCAVSYTEPGAVGSPPTIALPGNLGGC